MNVFRIISAVIALVGPCLVIVWDLIADAIGGPKATISDVIRGWSRDFHELPYLVAAIFVWLWMHLFFQVIVSDFIAPPIVAELIRERAK